MTAQQIINLLWSRLVQVEDNLDTTPRLHPNRQRLEGYAQALTDILDAVSVDTVVSVELARSVQVDTVELAD
jgi:hypothetical protein